MNAIHKRRLSLVIFFMVGLAIAAGLILYALKKNINAFYTPTQIAAEHIPQDYDFRLGGMVKKGSLVRDENNLNLRFIVTDMNQEVTVQYQGVLPDLFREGKGVIAEGHLDTNRQFIARMILAKHDENYTPTPLPSPSKKPVGGSK